MVLSSRAFSQGTAFTYQGQLQNNGGLASGTFNLQFSLYTNSSGGTAVAGPVTNSAVTITNGLFTVAIDFGAAVWNGQTNWLQIGVESNGGSGFTAMAPRQQLTPVPYSITAESVNGTLQASQLTSVGNTNGGSENFFVGPSGNATMTGSYNTALGAAALSSNTNGNFDTAIGFAALFANTSGSWNTAIGLQALFNNTSGSLDTASGVNALFSNTTGSDNTADGMDALYNNTFGSYNTATGFRALFGNTGGGNNTADGYEALSENFDGSFNTASGYLALGLNTSGFEDTAAGAYALENNVSGYYNTANGYEALESNTNGIQNTAIGDGALFANTSGEANTACGYGALFSNTTGLGNTAVGGALTANTSGDFNLAAGGFSLSANKSGSYNTSIGFEALEMLGNATGVGGSSNIAVGCIAGSAFTGNESNNIDIGNPGVAGESGVIRIGTEGQQFSTYLPGQVYANGIALSSDRNAKEQFTSIDPRAVLAKVAALPVTEWNYKTFKGMEHIGPMAQDFHAAFGLNGGDDKHISVVDEGGVAFAVIQGLNQKLEEGNRQQDARIQAQAAQIQSQSAQIQQLQQSLAQLKAIVAQLAQNKGE